MPRIERKELLEKFRGMIARKESDRRRGGETKLF
jgi:hypothetical protein